MIEEIKPCPFCGKDAELTENEDYYWYVECTECCARGEWFYGYKEKDKAIKAWNRRM